MQELEVSEKNAKTSAGGEDKLELLFKLLKSGEVKSLNDLQNQISPENPAENELVRRASLLRSFDEKLYVEVLRFSPDGEYREISFGQFTRNPKIEAVPRTTNIFRVRDDVRQTYLAEWKPEIDRTEKDDLFVQNIVSYYENAARETSAPPADLNLLGVLILGDLSAAEEKFKKMFDEADQNFDLARCHDILKTVEDRAELLPRKSALLKLALQNRRYLNARSFFAPEYYQTVFYYARQSIVKAFHDLLNLAEVPTANGVNDAKWIFHLYATGGMGKTMFIRWLIARYCVPKPKRTPVARLDFDFLHLPTVERFPWLLIVAIAEQIDRQIERSPFDSLLKNYGEYLPLLRPPGDEPSGYSRKDKENELQNITEETIDTIFQKHSDNLIETGFNKPFVVVLDTLEEMVLHHQKSLITVLEQLARLRDKYRQMRLLLSGRYNLFERLERFKAFENQTTIHELQPFDAEEAEAYLKRKRRLSDSRIVRAIIEKCESAPKDKSPTAAGGSNPFSLSLFADLYEQKDVQTAEEILDSPSVEFSYLIRRVILRVKEPTVRWLLRYAVVPRRFTFDVFENVVAPHLEKQLKQDEEQLSKEGALDRPHKTRFGRTDKFINSETWSKPEFIKSEELDLPRVWSDLRKYASGYGWISFDAEGVPRLHPEVTKPMRLLLEEQDVYVPLHNDAAKYFEQKAQSESDPKTWATAICEAIYHRFHIENKSAAKFWRKQFDKPIAEQSSAALLKIVEEITGADYTEEAGFARKRPNDEFLVEPSDLVEAHSRAIEILLSSTTAPDEVNWSKIGKHLNLLKQFRQAKINAPAGYRAPFSETYLRRLTDEMYEAKPIDKKTVSLLRQGLKTTRSRKMLLCFEMWLGGALLAVGSKEAIKHYEGAAKIRRTLKHSPIDACAIQLKIGQWYHSQADFDRSEKIFHEALHLAQKENNSYVRHEALRCLADFKFKQGQYEAAIVLIEKAMALPEQTGKGNLDQLFICQVQVEALLEPLESLRGVEPYLKNDKDLGESERAAIRKLFGDLMAMLMQFNDALLHLERAQGHWSKASNPGGLARVRLSRIKLQILDIGNYIEAISLLDEAEHYIGEAPLEIACQIRLLHVLLEHRNGNREAAKRLWQELKLERKMRQTPNLDVLVLATGLALGIGDRATVSEFIAGLAEIKPAIARLPLLGVFQFSESPLVLNSADHQAIARLLKIESRGKDFVPHAILRADALRACGDANTARTVLNRAGAAALSQQNSFAYRAVLLAKDRLNDIPTEKDSLFNSGFLQDFAQYPNLCAAGYIEQAKRHFKRREVSAGRECLSLAQDYLKKIEGMTTHLEAELNELFGEAARLDNDQKAALYSFNLALSLYEKLGNETAAERMRKLLPVVEQPVFDNEKAFTVRLNLTAHNLVTELHEGDKTVFKRDYGFQIGEPFIRVITADARDESGFYYFSKMLMGDLPQIEDEIGRILPLREIFARKDEIDKRDFKLENFSPALAKIPWEFARYEGKTAASLFRNFYRSVSDRSGEIEKIKWLQIALRRLMNTEVLVDGVFGLKTQATLSAARKQFYLPENTHSAELNARIAELLASNENKGNARALIVRSHLRQQILSQRNLDFSGGALDRQYQDCGFSVQTLWADELGALQQVLKKFQPDVIHIQSSFQVQPNTGQIYLDFAGGESAYSSERQSFSSSESGFIQPSPKFINQALSAVTGARLRPLVILDAACPPGMTEVIHQLLYRNIFAAELFNLGKSMCVIAMGLAINNNLQTTIVETLLSELSNTKTLGAAVNSVKKLQINGRLEEIIPTLGIALFTNEPSLTILSDKN